MRTKNCPYCGKEILADAKKCKHCRNWIQEPIAPTQEQQKRSEIKTQEIFNPQPTLIVDEKKNASRFLLGICVGFSCALLIGLTLHFIKPKQEQLYLMDIMQPNNDRSYYIGVVTNDFWDRLAIGKGWSGTFQIVTYKPGTEQGKFNSIISGSQLNGNIFSVYPSNKYSSVIYFSGQKYEEFEDFYGKVDIVTRQYKEFNGLIFGMITRGSYQDCYLVLRNNLLSIFPQSPIEEAHDPIITFDPKEHFGNISLWDPVVQEEIIKWLEKQ